MKTLRLCAAMAALCLLTMVSASAFADAGAAGVAAPVSPWAPLAVMVLGAIAYAIRNFTPNTGWLHTGGGHFIIATVTGALGAIADAIQTHGLSKQVVIAGLVSFVMGAISAANPSVQNGGVAPAPDARTKQAGFVHGPVMVMVAAVGAMATAILSGALLSGCATTLSPADATFAQKVQGDEQAIEKIASDVVTQCGPQMGAFKQTLQTAIQAAASYDNVDADILNAMALAADIKNDVGAAACVIRVVKADVKALTPVKAARVDRMLAQLKTLRGSSPKFAAASPFCGDGDGMCRPLVIECGDMAEACVPDEGGR